MLTSTHFNVHREKGHNNTQIKECEDREIFSKGSISKINVLKKV